MRIERIKSSNLTSLGDVDWTFLGGSVVLFSEDKSRQTILGDLLLDLFYDLLPPLALKDHNSQGLGEVWITEKSTHFHISRETSQQGNELEFLSTLKIEDETGQQVSLPETMTAGEYLFGVKLGAFRQGAIVEWPEGIESKNLFRLVRNLRQGGEEGLSLSKVRACMAGAQKRVKEQTESMILVKAEYDALRREWEEAHRQQEEERLLLIEIRNLKEKEIILAEKITIDDKLQERLALLAQNPDYRKLRHLQGELTQLEERYRGLELNLTLLTSESHVDWAVIEGLREECLEWAHLQDQVERLVTKVQMKEQPFNELRNLLQMSSYQGISIDDVQRMQRVEAERYAAQEKLDKISDSKSEIEKKRKIYKREIALLQNLTDMAEVMDDDEKKIAQRERRLAQWQNSKIGSYIDRILRDRFAGTGIGEKLSIRLRHYYQNYHVLNYIEFMSRLRQYRDQRQLVEGLKMGLERLQDKVNREENLRASVHSRTETLKKAFTAANADGFPAWLNGWEDHQQKKRQLALWGEELRLVLEEQQIEENKMATSAQQLREKLGNWEILATDRDEVFNAVLKVASQLRAKDMAEREVAELSQRYYDLLGDRDLEYLAKSLEPLADLERENRLSKEERLGELTTRQQERVEIRSQLATAEQRLHDRPKFLALSELEKKIEKVKRQWLAYEDLKRALEDVRALLETSWQEWQTKYGKVLNEEKQWIISRISSSPGKGSMVRNEAEVRKNYFAFRMAIAQLAIDGNIELPMLFSVGKINVRQSLWDDVAGYLRKLSLSRQVIFATSDAELFEKLATMGWQRIVI